MIERLTPRELATILAALRYFQQDLNDDEEEGLIDSVHFTEEVTPLSDAEIDDLCERLNLD